MEDETNTSCAGDINTASLTLKDRVSDFVRAVSNDKGNALRRVSHMIEEQQSEITLLQSRISSLTGQIDRQKDYYQKREDIIKEMYEEEISELEEAYKSQASDGISRYMERTTDLSATEGTVLNQEDLNIFASDGLESTMNREAAVGTHEFCQLVSIETQTPGLALENHAKDEIVASTNQQNFPNSERKSHTYLSPIEPPKPLSSVRPTEDKQNGKSEQLQPEDSFLTCAEGSPYHVLAQEVCQKIDKQLQDDRKFARAERLHLRTQDMYALINKVIEGLDTQDTEPNFASSNRNRVDRGAKDLLHRRSRTDLVGRKAVSLPSINAQSPDVARKSNHSRRRQGAVKSPRILCKPKTSAPDVLESLPFRPKLKTKNTLGHDAKQAQPTDAPRPGQNREMRTPAVRNRQAKPSSDLTLNSDVPTICSDSTGASSSPRLI